MNLWNGVAVKSDNDLTGQTIIISVTPLPGWIFTFYTTSTITHFYLYAWVLLFSMLKPRGYWLEEYWFESSAQGRRTGNGYTNRCQGSQRAVDREESRYKCSLLHLFKAFAVYSSFSYNSKITEAVLKIKVIFPRCSRKKTNTNLHKIWMTVQKTKPEYVRYNRGSGMSQLGESVMHFSIMKTSQ